MAELVFSAENKEGTFDTVILIGPTNVLTTIERNLRECTNVDQAGVSFSDDAILADHPAALSFQSYQPGTCIQARDEEEGVPDICPVHNERWPCGGGGVQVENVTNSIKRGHGSFLLGQPR